MTEPKKTAAKSGRRGRAKSAVPTGWSARLWRYEASGAYEFRVEFPTIGGETTALRFPRAQRNYPERVRNALDNAGAAFPAEQPSLPFVKELLSNAEKGQDNILVAAPGWHGKVFVRAKGVTPVRVPRSATPRLYGIDPDLPPTYLGRTAGTLEGWQEEVASLAQQWPVIAFAILTAFVAPLAEKSGVSRQIIFNFVGDPEETLGHLARIAASVSGSPTEIGHWGSSAREVPSIRCCASGSPPDPP